MNRIVDRSNNGRDFGLATGLFTIAGFMAFLIVAVLAMRSQVVAKDGSLDCPPDGVNVERVEGSDVSATNADVDFDVDVDGTDVVDSSEAETSEEVADAVIQKSSFGVTDDSSAAIRDLLMFVQVELFLAEADLTMPAEATEEQYQIDEEKIYYGNAKKFQKPCVIEAQKVYEGIPSYQKIVENGFTKDSPEYWPLMRKAASAFVRALKAVCKEGKFDLVGEIGAIDTPAGKVPDVTEEVLKLVTATN